MDNKNSILLVDPEFDPNTAEDCDLLMKITPDSLSYAIIDKNSKQLKAVYDEQECADIPQTLSGRLKNDSYLGLPFKEIKAAVYTENSINIPNELFNVQELDQYAKFFTEEQSANLYSRPFSTFGLTSIFTLQQFIEDTLTSSLNNYKLYAQNASVLTLAAQHSNQALVLDFTATSFNAAYTLNAKLIFQHYYQTDHAEEFNYYLLLIISQLNINTSDARVYLSGIINEGDAYYQCVQKYFNDIVFNLPPTGEIDQKILDDMPAHYYSGLLAIDLCE